MATPHASAYTASAEASSEVMRLFSSQAMENLLENMLNGIAFCKMIYENDQPVDFLFLFTNPAFHKQTGLGPVVGHLVSEIIPNIRESDQQLFQIYGRVASGGAPEAFVIFVEGLQQWYSISVYCPQPGHFITLFDVISERKNAEKALHERATQLQFVLEGSELGFWDWNIATNKVIRNERWALMLGYSHEELQQTTKQWTDFVHPDDRDLAWASINNVLEGRTASHKLEYRMLHKDGSIRWILDQAKVMERDEHGRAVRMCGTHTDVTDRKALEEELIRQAHFDYLTGVNNRRHFMERAENELRRANRCGNQLSIFMLDIDHFKMINDRYGHKVGDQVLKMLADVCRSALRDIDILARMGGEEFAVLLPETDGSLALEVARRLQDSINKACLRLEGDLAIKIQVSIGVASMTTPQDNMDILLHRADTALYEAKNTGRNRICVAPN